MNLQTGDIYFIIHNKNYISKLFSKVMKSKWSHSGIIYDKFNNDYLVTETNDFSVSMNFFNRYVYDENCSILVLRRQSPLNSDEKLKIQQKSREQIGILYGYLQLISLAIRRLISLKIPNFIRQGLVCCQVVSICYDEIQSPMNKIDHKSFDTEELYQKLLKNNWEIVYKKD